jgi:hypothetical protein
MLERRISSSGLGGTVSIRGWTSIYNDHVAPLGRLRETQVIFSIDLIAVN